MELKHKTLVVRKEHFNSAHRLHNKNWSDERNEEVFGKCNNKYFHGHNYELDVMVKGYCDHDRGYVIDTKYLGQLIKKEIIDYLDHKNLNLQITEFKDENPTMENIAKVIFNRLCNKLDPDLELKIRLYETPRNYVEYPG